MSESALISKLSGLRDALFTVKMVGEELSSVPVMKISARVGYRVDVCFPEKTADVSSEVECYLLIDGVEFRAHTFEECAQRFKKDLIYQLNLFSGGGHAQA